MDEISMRKSESPEHIYEAGRQYGLWQVYELLGIEKNYFKKPKTEINKAMIFYLEQLQNKIKILESQTPSEPNKNTQEMLGSNTRDGELGVDSKESVPETSNHDKANLEGKG